MARIQPVHAASQDASFVKEIYGQRSPRVRRLAVFGPRGSGKTCYFASLYGNPVQGDVSICFEDTSTTTYMQSQWDAYSSDAGFPSPTPNEVPQKLVFDLARASTDRKWTVEILDLAGALIERRGSTDDDLRKLVRDWLKECDAILIFIDTSGRVSSKANERRNEVAQLLGILREESERAKIVKPLGMLFTKWDDQQARPKSGEEAAKLVKAYLRSHPAIKQIRDTLDAFGVNVIGTPISALGWNWKPGHPPTAPYNLIKPLVWALEKTDQQRFLQAQDMTAKATPRDSVKIWNDLLKQSGISSGPVHSEILSKLASAQRRASSRKAIRRTLVLSLILVMLASGWSSWVRFANQEYVEWKESCDTTEGALDENAATQALKAQKLLALEFALVWTAEQKSQLEASVDRARDVEEQRELKRIADELKRLAGGQVADKDALATLASLSDDLNLLFTKAQGGKNELKVDDLRNVLATQEKDLAIKIRDEHEQAAWSPIQEQLDKLKDVTFVSEDEINELRLVSLQALEESLGVFGQSHEGIIYGRNWRAQQDGISNLIKIGRNALHKKDGRKAYNQIIEHLEKIDKEKLTDEEFLREYRSINQRLDAFGKAHGGEEYGAEYRSVQIRILKDIGVVEGRLLEANARTAFTSAQADFGKLNDDSTTQAKLRVLTDLDGRLTKMIKEYEKTQFGPRFNSMHIDVHTQLTSANAAKAKFDETVRTDDDLNKQPDSHEARLTLLRGYLQAGQLPQEYRAAIDERVRKCEAHHDLVMIGALTSRISKVCHENTECIKLLQDADKSLRKMHNKDEAAKKLNDRVVTLLSELDQFEYELAVKAVESARQNPKVELLKVANKALSSYSKAYRVPGTDYERPISMKAEADKGIGWFTHVEDGTEFSVELVSLDVPKAHLLFNDKNPSFCARYSITASGAWKYDAKPTYYTDISKTTLNSAKDSAFVDLAGLQEAKPAGKMYYKLGEATQSIIIWRLGAFGWWPAEKDASPLILDDTMYIPSLLEQGVKVPDPKGVELTLKIRCIGARIPELPKEYASRR